jgi:hypothetical protein
MTELDLTRRVAHGTSGVLEGVSQAELARQFGISYQRDHQIVRGETR